MVNLVSARPSGELEGKVELTMGNFNSERLNMVLNVPINERVGMRLATATFKRDGVIDNIHTGNDIDDRDNVAGRLSIDFDIPEDGVKNAWKISCFSKRYCLHKWRKA